MALWLGYMLLALVIAHLMALWLGYTRGRLWLSVSEERLSILDGDDARSPSRLCIGMTSRSLFTRHWQPRDPLVSDIPMHLVSMELAALSLSIVKAGLSTSTSRLRTMTRRWKGQGDTVLDLTTTTTD